ncbi:protein mono-ADP-ribosyltransferase PARP9-like [Argopecten irradians]|uniref:protein mono-ADP-ribosyltransferase PARP9-like n=1 Tax=Argopecten irradians TaxID=31199 RepID=UPI00371CFF8D
MSQYMRNCLKEADKRNCRTISFPALGTGNLGYPKDLVANTMFNAVKKYFQENPDSCVEGVNFVVYHKDRETVKAFEAEDKRQKEKTDEGVNEPVVTESSNNKRGYEIENDRQYPIGKPIGETEGKRIVGLYNEKAEHIKKAFKPPQSNTNQLQEEQWRPINESESPQITTGKMPATGLERIAEELGGRSRIRELLLPFNGMCLLTIFP